MIIIDNFGDEDAGSRDGNDNHDSGDDAGRRAERSFASLVMIIMLVLVMMKIAILWVLLRTLMVSRMMLIATATLIIWTQSRAIFCVLGDDIVDVEDADSRDGNENHGDDDVDFTRMIDVVMVTMLSGRHLTQIFLGLSAACTLPRLKYQIQQNIVSPFSIPIVIIITSPCKHYRMWPTIVHSYFNFDAF